MNHPSPSRAVLVFGRSPVPGRVKTRMIPEIGATTAAKLYRQMLFGALDCALGVSEVRLELWLDGPPVDRILEDYAGAHGIRLRSQQGKDLGLRMHHAFKQALKEADHAVLIGSDCPGIDTAYLQAAFEALRHHQTVIGPATDGGYVLIGLDRPASALFSDLPWSTDRVLDQTRQRLRELGWSWQELPPRQDVDRFRDLASYPELAAWARSASNGYI